MNIATKMRKKAIEKRTENFSIFTYNNIINKIDEAAKKGKTSLTIKNFTQKDNEEMVNIYIDKLEKDGFSAYFSREILYPKEINLSIFW